MLHRNLQFGLTPEGEHIPVGAATKFCGNYAYANGIGWYRFTTMAHCQWRWEAGLTNTWAGRRKWAETRSQKRSGR